MNVLSKRLTIQNTPPAIWANPKKLLHVLKKLPRRNCLTVPLSAMTDSFYNSLFVLSPEGIVEQCAVTAGVGTPVSTHAIQKRLGNYYY